MKQLSDGTLVAARLYYYLLDFNEVDNRDYIRNILHKDALHSLNKEEFISLLKYAYRQDIKILINK